MQWYDSNGIFFPNANQCIELWCMMKLLDYIGTWDKRDGSPSSYESWTNFNNTGMAEDTIIEPDIIEFVRRYRKHVRDLCWSWKPFPLLSLCWFVFISSNTKLYFTPLNCTGLPQKDIQLVWLEWITVIQIQYFSKWEMPWESSMERKLCIHFIEFRQVLESWSRMSQFTFLRRSISQG